ncbi:MAG: ATP-binding cassette domain-containing protein [Clostridiales Family XIII bacterium]|jgi:D-methionine transport system ATP-binding protein|nr:ATP-binding cassette domain-containing protein [Clostridiales Family XIII bacterium]
MITLEHVSKTFRAQAGEIEAVKDVSLDIGQGEIHGVIGFSGAGKSTLVRCMNLLERPDSGKVFVDGAELTALGKRELRDARRRMGMIFQQFNLFASRTALENVAYPLRYGALSKGAADRKARELLSFVGLDDKEGAYPSQLSGGQKQRVAIARALANDPVALLCDEATSALDPQTTHSILKLLKELNARLGITIVVITHEMQVVKEICGRVTVMENGEAVESGDVFSVFANPQKSITRDFIDTTTNISKITALIEEGHELTALKPDERILKFKYVEKTAAEALVSTISRRFGVDVNILFANLDWIEGAPLGEMISVVSGRSADIDAAMEFMRERSVSVEVILNG